MTTDTTPEHLQPTAANPRRDAWSAIEVIRHALSDGELHVDRILEQVKIRTTLTLRSDTVVSAIVRYFEAARLVPAPTLFRFITTATPSRERGVVLGRMKNSCQCWFPFIAAILHARPTAFRSTRRTALPTFS